MKRGEIYYFEETKEWWMSSGQALADALVLEAHIDAIHVTNPEVLDPQLIASLTDDVKARG